MARASKREAQACLTCYNTSSFAFWNRTHESGEKDLSCISLVSYEPQSQIIDQSRKSQRSGLLMDNALLSPLKRGMLCRFDRCYQSGQRFSRVAEQDDCPGV